MNEHFKRLQRLLPERIDAGRGSFDATPKALREWLNQLPYANPVLTASRLVGALREMNTLRIDPHRRLDALEILRRPVHETVAVISKQITGETFPMSPARLQASQTVEDFERELVLGYVAVVCDLCAPNGDVPFLRGRVAALAITRAIQHSSALLWNSYQTHSASPVGVWQTLHDLFRYAVIVRCDEKVEADIIGGTVKVSARNAYMQALLHAFAKPYHFLQKQNAELRDALPALATFCEIRPGFAPEGSIAVCTEGDHAPPGPPRGRQPSLDALWQLDVSGLLRVFDAELLRQTSDAEVIAITGKSGSKAQLSYGLVEKLVKNWRGRMERAFPRKTEPVELDSVIGLQAVHFVLFDNLDYDTFLTNARGAAADTGSENQRSAIWAGQQQDQARYVRAQAIDNSIGGSRIRWERGVDVRARVGELVALAPAQGNIHDWTIGMVRWLRVDLLGDIEAGIETLGQDARAISVRAFDARGLARAPMRGILVVPPHAAGDTGGVEPFIVVPHLFDREAIAVELTHFEEGATQSGARVEMISDMRIRQAGGLYLQIMLPAHMSDSASATDAANDDATAKFVQFPLRNG